MSDLDISCGNYYLEGNCQVIQLNKNL